MQPSLHEWLQALVPGDGAKSAASKEVSPRLTPLTSG